MMAEELNPGRKLPQMTNSLSFPKNKMLNVFDFSMYFMLKLDES